jgi:hypothetical protein
MKISSIAMDLSFAALAILEMDAPTLGSSGALAGAAGLLSCGFVYAAGGGCSTLSPCAAAGSVVAGGCSSSGFPSTSQSFKN